jgi:hypothetical protein
MRWASHRSWKRLHQRRQPQVRRLPPVQDGVDNVGHEQRQLQDTTEIAAVDPLGIDLRAARLRLAGAALQAR